MKRIESRLFTGTFLAALIAGAVLADEKSASSAGQNDLIGPPPVEVGPGAANGDGKPAPAAPLPSAPNAQARTAAPAPAVAKAANPPVRVGPLAASTQAQPVEPSRSAPSATPGAPAAASAGRPRFTPVVPPKDFQPPVLYIEQPRFDWGKIYKGEVVVHRFEMENKGGSPLMIHKVKPSCGCSLVSEDTMDRVIAPGGKGGFELKIETSRLPVGRQQKYADIQCNDPKQSQYKVFIQGQIDPLFKIEPEQPRIQTVRGKGQGNAKVTLSRTTPTELKIVSAKSQSGRLLVGLKEVTPNNAYELEVTTNYGPKDTQSYFSEMLQVEVMLGERKMNQDIPLTVQIKDRIEVNPRSVYYKRTDFDPIRQGKGPVVKTVDLKAAVEEPYLFKVTNLKLDDPDNFYKVKLDPVKDGREYRLTVTVDKLPETPADAKTPAASRSMKGNITLTTDDPMMPEINLRLIAFF